MSTESAITIASAAGLSLVTGTVLGLSIATLSAGFFGGLVALSIMPGVPGIFARVISVAGSTITAAFMAPYVAALAHMTGMNNSLELQAAAFIIGAGAQSLLPAVIAAMKRRIDQLGGGQVS